jgi:hypothetical protein
VIRLGITGKLRRTLESTNPWESTIDTVPSPAGRAPTDLRDELARRRSRGSAITATIAIDTPASTYLLHVATGSAAVVHSGFSGQRQCGKVHY